MSYDQGNPDEYEKSRQLVPDAAYQVHTTLSGTYDSAQKKYLWLHSANSFDANDHIWPLQGWIIDPKTRKVEEVSIPAGPWVQQYGFWDAIRGFSCGAQCYTKMNTYFIDNSVYVAIQGKLVKNDARGLYRLDRGSNTWIRVIAGTFNPYIFNQNGCQIIFKNHEEFYLADLCKQ